MGKGRAPCCDKSKVKRGQWSPQEDLTLISFIQKHGHHNWRSLPKLAGLMRCGKSCRLRWINYLRPDVKRGNFTKEEEDAIIHFYHTLGNKWSKIASFFPGRTDNEIKNVWNTRLKKRLIPASSPSSSSTFSLSSSPDQSREAGFQEEVYSGFNESQNSTTSSHHLQGQCMHTQPKSHDLHEIQLLLDYDDFDFITCSEFLQTDFDMLVPEQPLDSLTHISTELNNTCGSTQELTRPQSSDHYISCTFEEINRGYDLWEQMVSTSSPTPSPKSEEENNEWFEFIDDQTYIDDFTLVGEVCP